MRLKTSPLIWIYLTVSKPCINRMKTLWVSIKGGLLHIIEAKNEQIIIGKMKKKINLLLTFFIEKKNTHLNTWRFVKYGNSWRLSFRLEVCVEFRAEFVIYIALVCPATQILHVSVIEQVYTCFIRPSCIFVWVSSAIIMYFLTDLCCQSWFRTSNSLK